MVGLGCGGGGGGGAAAGMSSTYSPFHVQILHVKAAMGNP